MTTLRKCGSNTGLLILESDPESDVLPLGHSTPRTCMEGVVRKLYYCLCKNKGADQLCSNCKADHAFVFATQIIMDSTISLLKSVILSFQPVSVTVQVCLCQTWSETLKTGFLMLWLKYKMVFSFFL